MSLSILSLGGLCVNGGPNSTSSELSSKHDLSAQRSALSLETHQQAESCCRCHLKSSSSLEQLERHPATFDELGRWELEDKDAARFKL